MDTRINLFDKKQEEENSFGVLKQQLSMAGVFRVENQRDYGIDMDLEVANSKGLSTAKHIKLQVKSSYQNHVRENGHVSWGGIKQSTLEYWAATSRRIPVVGVFVDLNESKVFVSDPLFWQATMLLDGKDIISKNHNSDKRTIDFGINFDPIENVKRLRLISELCSIDEFVSSHRWLLNNLYELLSLYEDSKACDLNMESENTNWFLDFLQHSYKLCEWHRVLNLSSNKSILNQFCTDRNATYDLVTNRFIYNKLSGLLPILKEILEHFRTIILDGCYYWINTDPSYLKHVYKYRLPENLDYQSICKTVHKGKKEISDAEFMSWLEEQETRYGMHGTFFTKYNSWLFCN